MSRRLRRRGRASRRSMLGLLGTASVGAIAGCAGTDDEDDDPGTTDAEGTADADSDARIDVPDAARIDEPIDVALEGLSPGERATVRAVADHPTRGGTWTAEATFEPDDEGRIDLAERAPVDGDYDGVDPMGLFWAKDTGVGSDTAYFPLAGYDVDLSVRPADGDDPLAGATTRRALPNLETEPLGGDDLVGTVHLPPDGADAPGVLLLHGSGGEEPTDRARVIAANGFVAASVQYFGDPEPIPSGLVEVPVEYVGRAADALAGHERVAGDRVGVYGVSKGGEFALLSGIHVDAVGAVGSIVGSAIVWEGLTQDWRAPGKSSWSVDGEPVPYVPYTDRMEQATEIRDTYEWSFEDADEATIDEATIPVEETDAPILLASGGDDRLWDGIRYAEVAVDRLDAADYPHEYDHLVYEDAGHAIRPPYAPTYGLGATGRYPMGGTPSGNARAAADHWPAVLDHFAAALGE